MPVNTTVGGERVQFKITRDSGGGLTLQCAHQDSNDWFSILSVPSHGRGIFPHSGVSPRLGILLSTDGREIPIIGTHDGRSQL